VKRGKIIGWLLFALGIPFYFIAAAVSKEITGNMAIGIFLTALIMGGGWMLSHPKKRAGLNEMV